LKSAFVIGGAGFLGAGIARAFREAGCAVTSLDAVGSGNPHESGGIRTIVMSLPDASFGSLLSDIAPDVVIHCAGNASVPDSVDNPHDDFVSHVVLTEWLIHQCRKSAPRTRLMYLSSAAVYGQPEELPVHESAVIRPVSPYGHHKRMAEMLCEEASQLFGLQTVIARVFSAYGAGLRRQVVWESARQAVEDGRIQLHGTGEETRDFIHAQDVSRAILILAQSASPDGAIFNVASGIETSVKFLAEAIAQECGECQVTFRGQRRACDPERWRADIGKLHSLGFSPSISLKDGIRDVLSGQSTHA
jgi:UDP-glucose 4-epimerase